MAELHSFYVPDRCAGCTHLGDVLEQIKNDMLNMRNDCEIQKTLVAMDGLYSLTDQEGVVKITPAAQDEIEELDNKEAKRENELRRVTNYRIDRYVTLECPGTDEATDDTCVAKLTFGSTE
jgi:hypothetical protein